MAKRKRLAPANPDTVPQGAEVKIFATDRTVARRRAAPIADVAGDAAGQAAFEEVAGALQSARQEGRLVQHIALSDIRCDHLLRDRLVLDADEMSALKASLESRGQQTPIEVVSLRDGGYGLISGLRRVEALRALGEDNALALVRALDGAEASYVAMVEENEIRANLSFYERARVAAEAARLGVYPSAQAAVQGLFAHTSPSKRSKILSFVALHAALGSYLRFPAAIPEKLGLALVKAMDSQPGFQTRLQDALRKTPAETAAAERAALERALRRASEKKTPAAKPKVQGDEVAAGLFLETRRDRIVLRGTGLNDRLVADLRSWLADRSN